MPSVKTAQSGRSYDIAVIGGGIVGLWTAFLAVGQGLSVVVIEKRTIGGGASGGLLGALMPHNPADWNDKKQFQLEGLLSLEVEIASLEAMTGMNTGYRRCGRLMPIRNDGKRRQSQQWADAARTAWPAAHRWSVIDKTPDDGWLPPEEMPYGANADTLSAHISPRAMVAALRAALEDASVDIRENSEAISVGGTGRIGFADGSSLNAGRVVVAAGWESFRLLEPIPDSPSGRGVKGQAALLRPATPVDPTSPILYDNGVYVIAHENGLVAVGSTSENEFDDPVSTDDKLETVIASAMALSPALAGAQVEERWAGVRPRADGREPLVGPVPGNINVLVATGGFKISFAIAHLIAKAVLAQAAGAAPDFLPDIFLPANRLVS